MSWKELLLYFIWKNVWKEYLEIINWKSCNGHEDNWLLHLGEYISWWHILELVTVPGCCCSENNRRAKHCKVSWNAKPKLFVLGFWWANSVQKLFSFFWSRIWLQSGEEVKSLWSYFSECVQNVSRISCLTWRYIANQYYRLEHSYTKLAPHRTVMLSHKYPL